MLDWLPVRPVDPAPKPGKPSGDCAGWIDWHGSKSRHSACGINPFQSHKGMAEFGPWPGSKASDHERDGQSGCDHKDSMPEWKFF
jgi:hypothetical protein